MFELIFCGYNIFCHLDNVSDYLSRPKYPKDVETLCIYFEEQKAELPDYCKWKDNPSPPRRRSEF